jgi:hypothetical protein
VSLVFPTTDDIIKASKKIASHCSKVLSPNDLISQLEKLNGLRKELLETSQRGHKIDLFSIGKGPNTFWYGFPDPGEAVGATSILCLLKELLKPNSLLNNFHVTWNFIPCLNWDDQPDDGRTLSKVMKTEKQEVDWLVDSPRPETIAVLNCAQKLKPIFTFPLHDEFHCADAVPVYFPVSHKISNQDAIELKKIIQNFGMTISSEVKSLEMGDGFLLMTEISDIRNSTFYELSKHGLVLICEVPNENLISQQDLIATQIAIGLYGLKMSLRNING